ncbi:SDR family oxidoreductase [Pelobium manganitolerans]|uniref:SDR family oxidoreductase n=1 Tax=Pelobium manganitolerans TaxID=1842495 RepID=UPI003FA3D3EA
MKKIAIIGATGLLGKPVAQRLLDAGFQVRIIARNVQKAKTLFPHADVVYGDLKDRISLIKGLDGQDAVYLNIHIGPYAKKRGFIAETDGIMNLISAAKQAGIKRIAYLTSLVKDYQTESRFKWWIFDAKLKAVQLIKGAGVPYTIFLASSFMENFTKEGGFMNANNLNLVGQSDVKIHWISAADYAKQVCKSFQLLTDENREYIVQGPEAYTTQQALEIFRDHYQKKKLSIIKIPMYSLLLGSLLSTRIGYAYRLLYAKNHYREKFAAQFTWDELGKPTETIAEFTQRIQAL